MDPRCVWSIGEGPYELLAGIKLRYAIVAALIAARRPMSVEELLESFERRGLTVRSSYPAKAVADAVRWEIRRGRVARVRRGVYAAGTVAPSTRRRMLAAYGP